MPIDEQRRHAQHDRLIDVLGEDHAMTLISHLPPVGWADVATKRDLDHFADQLHGEVRRLHAETHATITAHTRTMFVTILTSNATLVALAFTAVRLA